jgi:hypothetical protein
MSKPSRKLPVATDKELARIFQINKILDSARDFIATKQTSSKVNFEGQYIDCWNDCEAWPCETHHITDNDVALVPGFISRIKHGHIKMDEDKKYVEMVTLEVHIKPDAPQHIIDQVRPHIIKMVFTKSKGDAIVTITADDGRVDIIAYGARDVYLNFTRLNINFHKEMYAAFLVINYVAMHLMNVRV